MTVARTVSPLLEVAGLSKRFGSQVVLNDFALNVQAGEVHALVGHNGSGKSTFVKCLAGFHQPEPGVSGAVDGAPFVVGEPHAAFGAGLRFVHQELGLVDELTAVDNIVLGQDYVMRRFGRIDWRASRKEGHDLLTALGYDVDCRRDVAELTLAERTAIAIARAIRVSHAGDARVIVFDEPTAALPESAIRELFEAIRRLQAAGFGIIYISHRLAEVFELASRVTVLREGRIVDTRDVSSLTEPALIELMVGRRVDLHAPQESSAKREGEVVLEVRQLQAGKIRNLDLALLPGEIVGVAGLAGSGRDDIGQALFGSTPRRGKVLVAGSEIPPERTSRAISGGLGLMPADRARTGLFADLSTAANLTLPRLDSSGHGCYLSLRREAQNVREWLGRLEIQPPDPSRDVNLLSGGSQQKVLLGRWLRLEPRVLILEEPTQGVDVGAKEAIYSIIRQYSRQGISILVCSSDTDELVALCHRVVVFNNGVVAGDVQGARLTKETIDHLCLETMDSGAHDCGGSSQESKGGKR